MKRIVCLLLVFSVIFSMSMSFAYASKNPAEIVSNCISFCNESGQLVSGIPGNGTKVYATMYASDLTDKENDLKSTIAMIGSNVTDDATEDSIITNSRFSHLKTEVLQAVSNLYLKKKIVVEY